MLWICTAKKDPALSKLSENCVGIFLQNASSSQRNIPQQNPLLGRKWWDLLCYKHLDTGRKVSHGLFESNRIWLGEDWRWVSNSRINIKHQNQLQNIKTPCNTNRYVCKKVESKCTEMCFCQNYENCDLEDYSDNDVEDEISD